MASTHGSWRQRLALRSASAQLPTHSAWLQAATPLGQSLLVGCAANRGGDVWEAEYHSFDFAPGSDTSKQPDERVLIDMITALVGLVVKGPSTPRELPAGRHGEVRARLRSGEPAEIIGRELGVDVDTIKALAR